MLVYIIKEIQNSWRNNWAPEITVIEQCLFCFKSYMIGPSFFITDNEYVSNLSLKI